MNEGQRNGMAWLATAFVLVGVWCVFVGKVDGAILCYTAAILVRVIRMDP